MTTFRLAAVRPWQLIAALIAARAAVAVVAYATTGDAALGAVLFTG